MTLEIRATIAFQAYMAQIEGSWGVITQLTRDYPVSRTFIYDLLAIFKAACGTLFLPEPAATPPSEEVIEARILTHRFEGRCSIDAIATLMKRDDLPLSSQGSVSQRLNRVGRALPNTLPSENAAAQQVVFANDEVYAKSQPILITVEPVSSAILRIELADNRTATQWRQHYEAILVNGFQPTLLTNDAGVGLCAAHAAMFADLPWQLDTFHAVAHRLGEWDRRLEKRLDRAVRQADEREATLSSAVSDTVIDHRLNLCFEADQAVERAYQLWMNFRYLYREIIQQLNTFDAAGHLRAKSQATDTIDVALELMETLGQKALSKPITSVRNALPHCLTYFDEAQQAVKRCEQLTNNQEALTALYLAWQWDKAIIKSKHTDRKHHAIEQRNFYLEWATFVVGGEEKALSLKANVYAELDQIIQASSMVECVNSLLRPYLNNSRNQVTQEFLNTFMFYHNHRRYRAGKRKGKTPLEILTGEEQTEDWVVLLQKQLRESESQLAA